MQVHVTDGVTLNVIATPQFKTTSISIDFLAPVSTLGLSQRILLAQLLETSSADYPTQTALAKKLATLYGASYGVNVYRYGLINGLRFSSSIINDQFANGENLTQEIFAFLKQVIFRPLASDGRFDTTTFDRQQVNLIAYLKSLNDDKQYYAERELFDLYFKEKPELATSLYGDEPTIEAVQNTALYNYYQQLLTHDDIKITVVGDVDADDIARYVADWQLPSRTSGRQPIVYQRPVTTAVSESETQPLQQSKLNLAYQLPVYYRDTHFYEALVFNGLFGGTPISLLFKNVREKNSLAYYASSCFDGFTGTLSVQAGIDQRNQQAVLDIITEQLDDIAHGHIDSEVFNQVVASLINNHESRQDSPRAVINQSVLDQLVGSTVSADDWLAHIQAVTPQQVAAIAEQVTLQATYFLKGDESR